MKKKAYIKPNLISEKFIPQTYCASCNFTTYKLKCTVSGSENSDGDRLSCTHRSGGCNNIEHQIITFDGNGYLKIHEIENQYFTGADCTIITSPTNDTPRTWHKDQLTNGQTIYWKTTGSSWNGDWECLHQGTVNLNEDNKGNLT
jgi:hypothetical protein